MKKSTSRARTLVKLLDSAFQLPGTRLRFGIDPLLGLIPGVGDLVGGGMAAYLLLLATRAGAPPPVLLRMGANIAVDTLVGAVPLLGDLLDAGWKANVRNLALLEQHLAYPQKARIQSYGVLGLLLVLLIGVVVGTIAFTVFALRSLGSWVG